MNTPEHQENLPDAVTVYADGKKTVYRPDSFAVILADYYEKYRPGEKLTRELLEHEVKEVLWGNIELDLRNAKTFTVVDENGNDVEAVFHPDPSQHN